MRRAIGLGVLVAAAAVSGCATIGTAPPPECIEVTRLQQQAELARASAISSGAQAGAWRVRTVSTMDPMEQRNERLENRRIAAHLNQRATELNGRASRLRTEARATASELRAEGIDCPIRRR